MNLCWIKPRHLQNAGHFLFKFVVSFLAPVNRCIIHLVYCYDKLVNSQSVCQKGMLLCLSTCTDSGFKFSTFRRDKKNGCVRLASASDHVLNEVSVSRSINDCELILWSFKFQVGDVNGHASFAFFFEFVQDPSKLEGFPSQFLCFFFICFGSSFINCSC